MARIETNEKNEKQIVVLDVSFFPFFQFWPKKMETLKKFFLRMEKMKKSRGSGKGSDDDDDDDDDDGDDDDDDQ